MKNFCVLGLFILSSAWTSLSFASAGAPIEAKMKYHVRIDNGKKDFHFSSFSPRTIMRMTLIWTNFDESLHGRGFDFNSVKKENIQIISPVLPENCGPGETRPVLGVLNGLSAGINTLSFYLLGDGCGLLAESMKRDPLVILFKDVSPQDGGPIIPELLLSIVETL